LVFFVEVLAISDVGDRVIVTGGTKLVNICVSVVVTVETGPGFLLVLSELSQLDRVSMASNVAKDNPLTLRKSRRLISRF
jgi:hypothetical protein